jgi:putative glutamine amidotransferase
MRQRRAPVLGLCRGMQLMNVSEGGTLKQELVSDLSHFVEPDGWIPYHRVHLVEGSRLRALVGCTDVTVSSVHHQAIDALAPGLRAAAHAADGTIEAIEGEGPDFLIGLQSHVEKTRVNLPDFEGVFAAFVATARSEMDLSRGAKGAERCGTIKYWT